MGEGGNALLYRVKNEQFALNRDDVPELPRGGHIEPLVGEPRVHSSRSPTPSRPATIKAANPQPAFNSFFLPFQTIFDI